MTWKQIGRETVVTYFENDEWVQLRQLELGTSEEQLARGVGLYAKVGAHLLIYGGLPHDW